MPLLPGCRWRWGVRTGLHIETLPAIAIGFLRQHPYNEPALSLTSVQEPVPE